MTKEEDINLRNIKNQIAPCLKVDISLATFANVLFWYKM